mgnify:CR=1 FL=1
MTEQELKDELNSNKIFKLQWHITHKCNLRCKHCYIDDYAIEPTRQQLFRVFSRYIKYLKKYNARAIIVLSGGEPFVSPYVFEIMTWLENEEHIREFSLTSNGTLITNEVIDKLKSFTKLSDIQISLDGGKQAHELIRGKGTFDKTINAIKLLRANNINVMISFTANKLNYRDLPNVVEASREAGANGFWTDRVVPLGDKNKREEIIKTMLMSTDEFKEYIELLYKEYKKNNSSELIVCMNGPLQSFRSIEIPKLYKCGAGIRFITITADGDLMPCRRLTSIYGNVLEQKEIEDILFNNLEETTEIHQIPDKCQKCRAKDKCMGGSRCMTHAVCNTYNAPDPNCFFWE